MKLLKILSLMIFVYYQMNGQIIIIPVDPKMVVETSLKGQTAIRGYSGPIGPIVPPPTDPNSIGVLGVGFSGVKGEAKADGGYGVHGTTNKIGSGVYGEASSNGGNGVLGIATGVGGWGVFGKANGEGEWGGYFSGGKGLLARPRLGVENFDPQYPIHVGTTAGNGNGAHVTNGGSWTSGSSRTFKEDFQVIYPENILQKISALKITRWKYKNSDEGEHIGPMAEDFYAAFALGDDEKYISSTDADGVALAAIQALYQRLSIAESINDLLQAENHKILQRIESLEKIQANSERNR